MAAITACAMMSNCKTIAAKKHARNDTSSRVVYKPANAKGASGGPRGEDALTPSITFRSTTHAAGTRCRSRMESG